MSLVASRRSFLRHIAASPLLGVGAEAFAQSPPGAITPPEYIKEASEALNVFELRKVAQRTMRPAHFGYLETGVLDDRTMSANEQSFLRWGVHARRLVDVSRIDLSTTLFGETWASPIGLAPVSSQRAFHHEAERPVAKAAAKRNALMALSTLTSVSIETVQRDRAGPLWFQLYPTNDLATAKRLVERADKAGATAIVFTVDLPAGPMRRETQTLMARGDGGNCAQCHDFEEGGFRDFMRRRGLFDANDLGAATSLFAPSLTWEFIGRIRDWTQKKILVKGVMTPDDAERALAHGADGVIVSNHGGRAEESLIAPLDVLPAIAAKINRRAPILIDSGFRRGTDAFKALALGASAVFIGRPYLWGLSAFGQEGVETAMRLMDDELRQTMRQAGVTRIPAINQNHVMKLG